MVFGKIVSFMSGNKASAASGNNSRRAQPAAGARNAPRGPRPVKQVPGRRRAAPSPYSAQGARDGVGPQNHNGPFSGVRIFYFFLFALLFLALYLSYLLVSPFLHTIILACIFTALSHPLYKRMLSLFRGNGWVASGVTLGILVIVVLLPLIFFIIQLVPQATHSIVALAQWLSSAHLDQLVNEKIYPFLGWLNDELTWIDLDVQDMRESLLSFSRRAGQMMLSWGTGFFVDSLNVAANFGLMLLIMFFLFKDGEGMVKTIKHLTPLRAEQEDSIIHNLRRMAKAVLMGGFAVAALQGFVGAIGLAIVGIPPLFWGTVMAFAALVPVLGTALIWVPAVVYLALTGQTTSALFLLAWCGILVTSVDSFLRPIIIRGNNKTSLLFLFLAVLGGIKAFGVLGIVYGPLILSFVGVMLAMYSDEYSESLETYHNTAGRKRKFGGPACSADGTCRKKQPTHLSCRALFSAAGKSGGKERHRAGAAAAPGLPDLPDQPGLPSLPGLPDAAGRPETDTPAKLVKTAAAIACAAGAAPGSAADGSRFDGPGASVTYAAVPDALATEGPSLAASGPGEAAGNRVEPETVEPGGAAGPVAGPVAGPESGQAACQEVLNASGRETERPDQPDQAGRTGREREVAPGDADFEGKLPGAKPGEPDTLSKQPGKQSGNQAGEAFGGPLGKPSAATSAGKPANKPAGPVGSAKPAEARKGKSGK